MIVNVEKIGKKQSLTKKITQRIFQAFIMKKGEVNADGSTRRRHHHHYPIGKINRQAEKRDQQMQASSSSPCNRSIFVNGEVIKPIGAITKSSVAAVTFASPQQQQRQLNKTRKSTAAAAAEYEPMAKYREEELRFATIRRSYSMRAKYTHIY